MAKYDIASPEGLKKNEVDPAPFLEMLIRSSIASRPEEVGEVRLLAWMARPREGQVIEPAVDLHQGFTLVVAHMKLGETPDPASLAYNILANGPEKPSEQMLKTPAPAPPINQMFQGMLRRRGAVAPVSPVAPGVGGLPKGMIAAPKAAMPVAPVPGLRRNPRTKSAPATPGMPGPESQPDDPDPADDPGAPRR